MNTVHYRRARKLSVLAVGLASLVFGQFASAQTTTFGQYFQQNGSTQGFSYTNGGTSATFSTISTLPIFFLYSVIPGMQADVANPTVNAGGITFTGTTNTVAVSDGGAGFNQLFQTINFSIIRTTPSASGGTNLLTGTLTNVTINFSGNSASFNVTSGGTSMVTFSSDFLDFSNTTIRNAGFSFSGASSSISQNANGFLNPFAISAQGTFASNPLPIAVVPEVSTGVIFTACAALVILGEIRRRRRSAKSVGEPVMAA